MRALKMRSTVTAHLKLTMTNWEQSSKLVLLQLMWEAAEEPSVNHSMVVGHLKQIGKAKKLEKWEPLELIEKKKIIVLKLSSLILWVSFVAQLVKNLPAMRETWVRLVGCEDPLEKWKDTHPSILAWRIPWTVYPWVSKNRTWPSNFHTFFLLLFYTTTMNHFCIRLWCVTKSGFYMTTRDDRFSGWKEEKLQSTSQSQTCSKKLVTVTVWLSVARLSTTVFWIPVKPSHLRSMQEINEIHWKLQCL